MDSAVVCGDVLNVSEGLRRTTFNSDKDSESLDFGEHIMKQDIRAYEGVMSPDEPQETLKKTQNLKVHTQRPSLSD